jgi:type IV pilus assembly protein PilO
MTPTRTWSAGAAVIGILLVIAAWFLLIAPERSNAADLRDQVSAQEASNEQIALKTKQLEAQFASLPARQAQLAEIKQQMPDNPALPSLIRDLSSNATSAGVNLVSISPAEPQAVDAASAAGVTAPGAAPAPSATALQAIPTTVTVSGSYAQLTLYLQKLQSTMRRAFMVQSIQLIPATGGAATSATALKSGALQMTVMGNIYVLGGAGSTSGQSVAPTTTPAS